MTERAKVADLRPLPRLVFGSRWLQLPLYLGLIAAQCVYVLLFLKELKHLVLHALTFDEQQIMLIVLDLIDVVMISNLLIMVIIGGYETFVSRLGLAGHPDEPEWLSHVDAGILKIKLAMAIIGISSINLLRTFIEAGNLGRPGSAFTESGVMWQTVIHAIFIFSAIGIAMVERLSQAAFANKDHRSSGNAIAHESSEARGIDAEAEKSAASSYRRRKAARPPAKRPARLP